jgi:hypothetical protein
MDDSEKNIFHSSNIANQTLAGSVSDPFTLTEKEKKRQEKLSELLEKRQQKAAKKEERARKRVERREKIATWRKTNPLLFMISVVIAIIVSGAALFGVGVLIVNLIPKRPLTAEEQKALIDINDPISVNCQCEKGSKIYNTLKKEYEESEKNFREMVKDFNVKKAGTIKTINYVGSVIGNYVDGAIDKEGNFDTDKVLEKMKANVEQADIPDDQKRLFDIYFIRAYVLGERYNDAIKKLDQYNPDELLNSEKTVYYTVAMELYKAVGNDAEYQSAREAYNALPEGEALS